MKGVESKPDGARLLGRVILDGQQVHMPMHGDPEYTFASSWEPTISECRCCGKDAHRRHGH